MLSQLDAAKNTTKEIIYNSFHDFADVAVDDKRLSEFTLNRENAQILKNRKENLITTTDLDDSDIVSKKLYLLEEKIPPQQWQFGEEETEILGYLCQKAVCHFRGRDYTAWFTLDIPISDGPYKFHGLPGLILMMEDSEKMFQFTAIGLEQLANVEIVSDNKKDFIVCTPQQYSMVKKRMQETNVLYYSQGETLFVSKRRIPIVYKAIEAE
ncbi:MAG: GLPGLI family protein [Petrimonas sp.]|uniref:GLPGLI family protein n=1 Tax=Petrimonas sp. TaxID=2023866 RepID=UPI002B3D64A5|nr:GLPGLI family protein [Petrimonas sp.]